MKAITVWAIENLYCIDLHLISGSDAILLGAETLRGLYPVETISVVGKICAEVSFCFLSLACFHGVCVLLSLF